MREWLPEIDTLGQPVPLEDLIFFCDCYYLPHEEGPEADAFFECARSLLSGNSLRSNPRLVEFRRKIARLREFCLRMTELRNRPLFYAWSRRIWELREELDLLERYVEFLADGGHPNGLFHSDSHLPGTYRGGMVLRLQHLLDQHPDGAFTPAYLSRKVCNPRKNRLTHRARRHERLHYTFLPTWR